MSPVSPFQKERLRQRLRRLVRYPMVRQQRETFTEQETPTMMPLGMLKALAKALLKAPKGELALALS